MFYRFFLPDFVKDLDVPVLADATVLVVFALLAADLVFIALTLLAALAGWARLMSGLAPLLLPWSLDLRALPVSAVRPTFFGAALPGLATPSSVTRRKSILRASRSTRLTCTVTRSVS